MIRKSPWKEFLKFQVNETNFGSVFLVKNVCIKFMMYEILLWELRLVFTVFIFAIKIKLLKNYQKYFLFYQQISFCPRDYQIFVLHSSPLFSFLGHCLFDRRSCLKINFKVYDIFMSLSWILKTQIL